MKQQSKDPATRKLLGYFMVDGSSSGCLIVDWLYSKESLNYFSGDDNHPQIIIPTDADIDPGFPRFHELGYISAGVYPSIELRDNDRQEQEIREYDIPVYAIATGDSHTIISVEIEEWIPTLKILDEAQEEEIKKKIFEPELCGLLGTKQALRRHKFGYATATGGGILICDMDFVRMCREYHDCIGNQVIVSADGEESPGFRAGVIALIPEELQDREFPVYGEYEGDLLKRITIEIAENN
ncbi:MAG TPA: hypothetical protein DEG17_02775 [Cyanobacteria bacterium UBA11149]|nr:hypothetical protein [Cyanobacteria bacterium UBA11367]HBE56812.1 hypothetical protein [Cyanobacteria bacterium UBA11366]HBK64238.1 hypothetical protein [Cyanobacteria bacterium UBA11166]HBR73316.1 hypothetical protein [Cyanobacteria bacterium UBA11159]HBS72184.1 hypothetical protein [Cyanobacteria bacterium UBA11153]HBW87829.1 hypothetical protein [Cyanobacteria bacterium UBA11149]HCA95178.1 hypothetical protein [Cyanobacteria bacterium UBA9226]